MKNRNHLIALILVAGIASSSMLNGKRTSMGSFTAGLSASNKVDLKWEGVRTTHIVYSIDQYIADFFYKLNSKSLLEFKFRPLFSSFIIACPFISTAFDSTIFINAP